MRVFAPPFPGRGGRGSPTKMVPPFPATTNAYQAANIFARASGYIEKRYVDIGSRETAGHNLAGVPTPELDPPIAQAPANLVQSEARVRHTEAIPALALVTRERNSPLGAQN